MAVKKIWDQSRSIFPYGSVDWDLILCFNRFRLFHKLQWNNCFITYSASVIIVLLSIFIQNSDTSRISNSICLHVSGGSLGLTHCYHSYCVSYGSQKDNYNSLSIQLAHETVHENYYLNGRVFSLFSVFIKMLSCLWCCEFVYFTYGINFQIHVDCKTLTSRNIHILFHISTYCAKTKTLYMNTNYECRFCVGSFWFNLTILYWRYIN
jgi:hypothetical protein